LFELYSNIFFFQKKHHDPLPNYFKISTSFTGSKYISELSIEEILTEDVGFYSCHYNKVLHNEVVRNKYNSIYVFVTGIVTNAFTLEFN
jgi:hypothetical protein